MNREPDIFERIGKLFAEQPKYFGVFVIVAGAFMVAAALGNWDWVFRGYSYNTEKIEGTANRWGRGFARLKLGGGGFLCVIVGIGCLAVL
ncbi:MAG: hypothetical protein LBD24_00875 [Spirochaetaceae bacterium]|jgi:hypothetical protein|nr:hypothetical protein [Spirochaetaceae bacterium]